MNQLARLLAVACITGAVASAASVPAEPGAIDTLLRDGRYVEALATARLALRETEAARGASSLETAAAIDRLVDVLGRCGLGGIADTRALAERALTLRAAVGTEDAGLADSLFNLGAVMSASAEFRGAQEALERALALRETIAGTGSPTAAMAKERLGTLLANSGKADRARALLEEAAAALREPPGANDAGLATVLTALGGLLTNRGGLADARQALDQALAIRRRLFPPDHPEIAATLYRQAYLKRKEGDAAQALALADQALAIREARLPAESLEIASSLGLRAELRFDRGDLPGSRADAERALAMRRSSLRPGHPLVATSLKTYAVVLFESGDYAGARPLFEQALDIERQALGPSHPQVALSLTNLGSLLFLVGDYPGSVARYDEGLQVERISADQRGLLEVERANSLVKLKRFDEARRGLETSLATVESQLGPGHFVAGWMRFEMGLVEEAAGHAERAAAEAAQARTILETALGEDQVKLASVAALQGRLASAAGRHDEAEPLFARARDIFAGTRGLQHPELANTIADWGEARWRAGQRDEALDHALEAARIRRELLTEASGALSEREALLFRRSRGSAVDVALSRLAVAAPPASPDQIARTYDEVIRSRAQVLDEVAWRQRLARESDSDEARLRLGDLEQARTRLARAVLAFDMPGSGPADAGAIDRARSDKEEAERALAEWSAAERALASQRTVGLAEVRAALPGGSALVSFVRYEQWPIPAKSPSPAASAASPGAAYLAFVVRPESETPDVVTLGPAEPIEKLVRDWMKQAGAPPASPQSSDRYREVAGRLAKAIWQPIAARCTGCDLVLMVPDGLLQFVSWASLPVAAGKFLVESGPTIHLLSAERSLVAMHPGAAAGHGLLALGGPDFDARIKSESPPPAAAAAKHGETNREPSPVAAADRGRCQEASRPKLPGLPSAVEEARDVARLWEQASPAGAAAPAKNSNSAPASAVGGAAAVTVLTGADASEAALRSQVSGRRVIHLATHAFFLPPTCGRPEGPVPGMEESQAGESGDALLRTGLALAGANRAWTDRSASGETDGLLTAEEIASLDLRGVEWAVLSACGTGLGRVEAGEGILGLRRTFEVAGAGTLLTSLWTLEDHTARQWIRALYRARLKGASTATAVREASRSILASRRRAGLNDHPYYWAGFVAAGDWR
ncbi:MAG TPA: tetratricopeptide repeat protein [Candidatus Polarisedimenticolia bacterium]|nr:tetratricopeptide repeat protein [Candidatus Polarisedimenticolia bacterium]